MVTVKPLQLADVKQMSQWGTHTDLRFEAYNFPYTTTLDYILWYHSKRKPFRKYIYGAFLETRLIGYITFKNIDWLARKGEMGVVFDPNYINQGYGTEAIKQYLALVFGKFPINRIMLKTAKFNVRGQRCYEKVGFRQTEVRFEPYEDQSFPFELIMNYEGFQMIENELWTEYVYMMCERPNNKTD